MRSLKVGRITREKMMLDEGFGSAPNPDAEQKVRAAKYRMAQADEALLRLCRLCVSIKMHTQGMSVADGAKFFHENCYYEEKPSMSEAMRGTFDPGYLNYTLGKLEILKLRDDYKAQEGTKFLAREIPQRNAESRHAADSFAPRDLAQGRIKMGRSALRNAETTRRD